MAIRSSITGIVIGFALYVLSAFLFGTAFTQFLPFRYYVLAPIIGPSLFLAGAAIETLAPRHVTIQSSRILVLGGHGAGTIDGTAIHRWKIAALPNDAPDVVLLLKRNDRPRGKNCVDIGISRRIDLIKLDRTMRRVTRVSRISSLRSQRDRNG